MMEDNYRFGHSSHWVSCSTYAERLAAVSSSAVIPIASAFMENMVRVHYIQALVPEIAFWTRITQRVRGVAEYRLGRPVELPGRVRGAAPIDPELREAMGEAHVEWMKQKPNAGECWQDGCDLVNAVVSIAPEFLGKGLEAIMSAALTELWATVEACLIDAWAASLNFGPNRLSKKVIGKDQSITFDIMQKYDFNISQSMGDVLVKTKKVDMSSSAGIGKAYSLAFGNTFDDIFKTYRSDISHLEAVRNLFAHRSGRIDEVFINRMKSAPFHGKLKIGENFKLQGDLVSSYILSGVNYVTEVLIMVDKEMQAT